MAKGVALTFREHFKEYLDIYIDQNDFVLKMEYNDEDIKMGNKSLKEDYPWAYKKAFEKTRRDTHEAMVAFIANMGSMHSRSGAQVVFSSINYGTDDSPEGRMVIEETLNAVDEGLGDGSTPIFPISVFRVKEGLSFSEKDWELAKNNWEDAVKGKIKFKAPNMDLFIKACEVSARRLFPNFVYEDTPFNHNPLWKKDDPNRYKYEICTMGCRTRVYDDLHGEKTSARRGNIAFTTINLPRLAIESVLEFDGQENKTDRNKKILDLFMSKLDYYMTLCHDQLYERYKFQKSAVGQQFPFIISNNMIMGTENIGPNDHMDEVLKHGSISIGFIGLAEALKMMFGKHHGESDEMQEIGLQIVGHMRERTDKMMKDDDMNWSLFATPAEGLSGRFTMLDRKKFGIIEGVTDKDFYTNSNHCPVYYNMSAIDKIRKEAPYHALTNAGHICYIELDGDPRKNTLAFASIVVEMKHTNIGYGAINHAVDRCLQCGYEGIIENECPKCGSDKNISHLRRITGNPKESPTTIVNLN